MRKLDQSSSRLWQRAIKVVLLVAIAALIYGVFAPSPGSCLVKGSLVATPNGEVAIESLAVGDAIYTLAPDGSLVEGRITKVMSDVRWRWLELVGEGGRVLRATAEHPFRSRRGWTSAGDVRAGDVLMTENGWVEVRSITHRFSRKRVYDLSVEPHPIFFVSGIVTHNKRFSTSLQPPFRGEWAIYSGTGDDADRIGVIRLTGDSACEFLPNNSSEAPVSGYASLHWIGDRQDVPDGVDAWMVRIRFNQHLSLLNARRAELVFQTALGEGTAPASVDELVEASIRFSDRVNISRWSPPYPVREIE